MKLYPMRLTLLLFFCRCLAKIPLPLLRALGSALGWLVYCLSKKTRHTVASNLAQAQLSGRISVRAVVQANVRGFFDMVWVWFNPAQRVARRCSASVSAKDTAVDTDADNMTILAQALDGSQATILLTPHLGCFEALAKWYTHTRALTAMYRRPDKAWVGALIACARSTANLTMAPADASGVRTALKTLRAGGSLGILPDQAPRKGEGVWLPWFGRAAYTITLPAKLHLATQARIYVIAALPSNRPHAGWQLVCRRIEVPQSAHSLSATELTLHLNQALEHMVLSNPLQYAWSYKRYKGQAPNGV